MKSQAVRCSSFYLRTRTFARSVDPFAVLDAVAVAALATVFVLVLFVQPAAMA